MKAIYRHKTSGDVFAIETDATGRVVSTWGPLFGKDFYPNMLDCDAYWNNEIQLKFADFQRVTKDDYLELLRQNGFVTDFNQRYLF